MKVEQIPRVTAILKREYAKVRAPVMDLVAVQSSDPHRILLGTILSARTKDACTAAACERLFKVIDKVEDLNRLSCEQIEKLIYPVGFYRDKARHLKKLPQVLAERFGGELPQSVEELCELPGVGRKTANLVVALAFGKPAICVDVHVHRIANRWGLLATRTPYETEMVLREILPLRYWIVWNSYLVAFGQTRCLPRNPRCGDCPLRIWCEYGGGERSENRS